MKRKISLESLLKKGKCLFLAYDQGLEHGPTDFNDANVDPLYIIDIARKSKVNGLVVQKGIAEQYRKEIKTSKIPLIIKLNGKTGLYKGEPKSTQLCTVKEAIKLGAKAVGYTIYIGSQYESDMFREFEQIEREAHAKGIPVIAWVYPRGKSIKGKSTRELQAYAARVALELGADMVKLHWNGNAKDLTWAVKSAGICKLVVAGGLKTTEASLLRNIKQALAAGATGFAIGRNIWQHPQPLVLIEKIKKVLV